MEFCHCFFIDTFFYWHFCRLISLEWNQFLELTLDSEHLKPGKLIIFKSSPSAFPKTPDRIAENEKKYTNAQLMYVV